MSQSTASLADESEGRRQRTQGRVRRRVPTSGSRWAFRFLMGFTVVLVLSPQSFVAALRPLHLALVTALLAGAVYARDRLSRGEAVLPMTRATKLTLGLLGLAMVTLPLSYWPGGSFHYLRALYLKALIIFWMLSNVVTTPARLKKVAVGLTAMAFVLALSGIRSFFSGGFSSEEVSNGLHRIIGYDAGLTANPNDLALMLNLILPLTIALLLNSRKPLARAALALCVFLDAVAIVATFSRAGFLVLGVISIIYLWKLFARGQRALVFGAMGLLLLAMPLLPGAYMSRLATITDVQADPTGSEQARLAEYIAAVEYVAYHPLIGAGIGMDILALNGGPHPTWTEVHNVYLQYAVELGLPGLALFVLLWVECFRSARQALRRSSGQSLHLLAEGLSVSLIGFAVAGMFYPDAYEFYFYYIAGLAVAAGAIAARPERHRVRYRSRDVSEFDLRSSERQVA